MNKKWLLGLGGFAAIALPVSTVVACNSDDGKDDSKKEEGKKINNGIKDYSLQNKDDLASALTKIKKFVPASWKATEKDGNYSFDKVKFGDFMTAVGTDYVVRSYSVMHGNDVFSKKGYLLIDKAKFSPKKVLYTEFKLGASNKNNDEQSRDRDFIQTLGVDLQMKDHIGLIKTGIISSSTTGIANVSFNSNDNLANPDLGIVALLKIA